MKKSLFALVALNGFCAAAHAQGSVTLYGIVDAGLGYTSN
ncbi:MAG: porin, partial [Paraburkholderia sp.]